jgi:serine/threonine protein kinase
MAVVYFGTDDGLNRAVALKTLPHISIERARRLRREARAMASIQHPHLAMIYGIETWHSMPILVVEYFQHGTLADRLRRGSLSAREVRELGLHLARALQYLHGHGLLHRDIKPSNIGLTENDTPKLLDFGLARVIGTILPQRLLKVEASTRTPATSSDGRNLTRSHHVIGTIAYLAPEALRYAPPSTTFDLWSLAVTLYEAFAGTHPFIRASVFETANAIVTREAADIRELRPDCPEGLAELLSDCLSLDASRRPLTADDVTARLEAIAC